MAFTKFTDPIDHIAQLSDRPNDQDGMTAAALKAAFDQAFADTQEFINDTLIEELDALAADVAQNTEDIAEIETGAVTDGSITTAKLDDLAVTAAKIAALAVTTAKLADLAVTAAKLAAGAVTTDKLDARAVTGGKIALGAVASENIGSKAVTQAKLGDGAVGTEQIADGAVTMAKTSGVQKQHAVPADYITLANSGWDSNNRKQVDVAGVTASNTVFVSPWVNNTTPGRSNWINIRDYGIRCVKQLDGALMFECETVPPSTGSGAIANLWFSVAIFD